MSKLALSLDRRDPQIAGHIVPVLTQVMTSLVDSKSAVDGAGDADAITQYMVLTHVLGSIVQQSGKGSSP